jgi:hypothetical protein
MACDISRFVFHISQDFLIKLVHDFSSNNLPFIIGGVSNIIRKASECNKSRLPKWTHLSNAILENWEQKEVESDGRLFTWSNNEEILLCLDYIEF